MRRPDDPPDVDFVLAYGDPGVDEELQHAEVREWPGLRRARMPLAAAAVIGIAAAAVVTIQHSQPHRNAVARATSSPTASTPAVTSSAPVPGQYERIRGGSRVAVAIGGQAVIRSLMIATGPDFSQSEVTAAEYCPKSVSCSRSTGVPMATILALRRRFPHVHAIRVTGVLAYRAGSASTVWARHITAHEGPVELAILIRRPTDGDPTTIDSIDDGRRTTAVFLILDGAAIEVEATAPRRDLPPLAQLRRLALDRGLLAAR